MDTAADTKRPTVGIGFYACWAEVAWDAKRWPHFTAKELSCTCQGKHCRGEYFHDPAFLDALERLRAAVGAPLVIRSGRRCRLRNAEVGGALRSQHMLRIAADIALRGHDPVALARAALAAGFTGIGFGGTFLHVDMRTTRTPFHYTDARPAWTARFGFDPVERLKTGEWRL